MRSKIGNENLVLLGGKTLKILSEKKSICTSIKVLYEHNEDYYEDMKQKKKDGWHPSTKPSFYNENTEIVIKHSSEGAVITYLKFEPIRQ